MNINIPNLIKAAVPEAEGRNARIISHNGPNHRDPGFLSKDFPRSPPTLYVTAESDDFDELAMNEWRAEGYDVRYIPMGNGGDEYREKLRTLSRKNMGPCESFGIVAYGDAAALCLEHYHIMDNNPEFKLGLLIAYYPTAIPDPQGSFPNGITVVVHLAASEEIGIIKQTQMIGIQGKRRVTRRKFEKGLGTGGTLRLAFPGYTYHAAPGFAEHDLDEYDRVSAELAWSRSLAAASMAFARRAAADMELALEENVQGKFYARNLKQTLSTFTTHKSPHVTNMPTLTGGIGADELETFYSQFFANPPSLKLTLISRTIGADRVVDEMHVRFKHTQEMPWILPGVSPTNKWAEVMVVSIVALRGGRLYHEHVYWDQASVLVQIGLLNPRLNPEAARRFGVARLPVVGKEAARRVLGRDWDEDGEADNELIFGDLDHQTMQDDAESSAQVQSLPVEKSDHLSEHQASSEDQAPSREAGKEPPMKNPATRPKGKDAE